MKIVIVGGVVGGMFVVIWFCCLMEDVEIIVFEKGLYVFFVNCGLFYYFLGEISDWENFLV